MCVSKCHTTRVFCIVLNIYKLEYTIYLINYHQITNMDTQKYTLSSLRQDIIDNNLHVKAIIQVNTDSEKNN